MTDLDGMGMSNPDEEFQPDTGWVERQCKRMAEDNTLRVTVAHLTADLRAELAKARRLCGEALPYVAGKRFRWEMGSTILADDLALDLKEEAAKGDNG